MVERPSFELVRFGQSQAIHPGLRAGVPLVGRHVVGFGLRAMGAGPAPALDAAAYGGAVCAFGRVGAVEPELLHAAPTRIDRGADGVVVVCWALSTPCTDLDESLCLSE